MATAIKPAAARPILKYVGGKTALLPELLRRMPRSFERYHEPFVGGGALFFRVQSMLIPHIDAILSDLNGDLIATYRVVASQPQALIDELEQLQKWHWKSPARTFDRIRTEWNASRWTPVRSQGYWAAVFVYLNRTCFNGLYRVNSKGDFNVPLGRYKKPLICDPKSIEAAARELWGVSLLERSFRRACADVQEGDFAYFDPPYDPVSRTASFTAYTGSRFGEDEQRDLAFLAGELVDKGAKAMLSNSDTPLIRKLYKGRKWRIDRVMAPRSINSNGKKRGKVAEVIITGGYRRHW
jgi:DNA adenine methylase